MKHPEAQIVSRARAIDFLGVTYAHNGHWTNAVRELLGRHNSITDPLNDSLFFQREEHAVSHLRSMARAEAKRKIDDLTSIQRSGFRRQKLWLARNWDWLRNREQGMLATQAIFDRALREAETVVEDGALIEIDRLPEEIRLPQVLEIGTPTWLVDARDFPRSAPKVNLSEVVEISVRASPEHPVFDFLVRYRLNGVPGLYGFDSASTDDTKLSHPPGTPSAYLTEEAARFAMSKFAAKIQSLLAIGGARIRQPLPGQDTKYLEDHREPEREEIGEIVYDFEVLPALEAPPETVIFALPPPAGYQTDAVELEEVSALPAIEHSSTETDEQPKKSRMRLFLSSFFAARATEAPNAETPMEPKTELEAFLASGVRHIRPTSIPVEKSLALKILTAD